MQAIYAFGILILISFLGARFVFRRKNIFSPLNYFFSSGLIYIFLGLYLGKHGLNILSVQVLEGLTPLISLGLGWIGFLFGFQLERKYLRRFPGKYITLSFLQALFVFFLVFVVIFLALKLFFASHSVFLLYGIAVTLGLLVTLNSPALLNAASSKIPEKGNYYYLARFLASISAFWGIVGLAFISSFWHFPFFESKIFEKGLLFLLISTAFPFILGYFFHFLTLKKTSEQDLLVYILGLVFFVSGAAFYFNLPTLYVSMVMGITYSNLTKIHEKIYPLFLLTEKPLYVVLMVLMGALWDFNISYEVSILVALLFVVRIIGYVFPLRLFQKILNFPFPLPAVFGLCFLSYGGIGVAFAVSIKLAYPLVFTDVFLSSALIVIIFSDILGPWALKLSIFPLDSEKKT